MSNPFQQSVIDAVAAHMNEDHEEDSLLIVRSLGKRPEATAATMSSMDGNGVDFDAVIDGATQNVRVPWSRPLTERGEVRVEITQMYHDACAMLGITPRDAAEH